MDFFHPSAQSPFGAEPQPFVERFSIGGGIETHAGDPPLLPQMADRPFQQGGSYPLTTEIRMHQHHSDPGKVACIGRGGRRSRRLTVHFSEKAPFRSQGKETFPVPSSLVPAGEAAEFVAEGQVGREKGADEGSHGEGQKLRKVP